MPQLYIMPSYQVDEKVETGKDLLKGGALGLGGLGALAAGEFLLGPVGWIAGGATAALGIKKAMSQKMNPIKISLEELNEEAFNLTDVSNAEKNWNVGSRYLSHPLYPDKYFFIEESQYQEFILREMVSEVADFIMGHHSLHYLTVAMLYNTNFNSGGQISTKNLNANARLDYNVDRAYNVSVTNTNRMNYDEKDYMGWINRFPDLKSFVLSNAKTLENTYNTSVALDINFAVTGKAGIKGHGATKTSFYIAYEIK